MAAAGGGGAENRRISRGGGVSKRHGQAWRRWRAKMSAAAWR